MSEHDDGKTRRLQAAPPSREGGQDRHRDSADPEPRIGAVPNLSAFPANPPSWTIPTSEQIAVRAYENWEARGKPAGSDQEDWFEADRQLQEETKRPSLEDVPEQGTDEAEIGNHRLSDVILHQESGAGGDKGRGSAPTRETVAEQTRDAKASAKARRAGMSDRERMVDIGRGNQQAGR